MKAVAVLALVVAVAAAVVGVVALVSGDDGEELTLTFSLSSPGSVEFNPIGERDRPGPGEGYATAVPLEDEGGEEAGSIEQICIFTKTTKEPVGGGIEFTREGTCLATAILPDGQLVLNLAGPLDRGSISGSIIGGTGDYTGAYGTYEATGFASPLLAPATTPGLTESATLGTFRFELTVP